MIPSEFPTVSPRARAAYGDTGVWDDRLLDAHLDDAVRLAPQRTAVVDGDVRLSYGELNDAVARVGAGLRGLGVGRFDVVSFQLPNWWEALVLHFAVVRIGAVSNPLMPILRDRELRFMVGTARSKVLVVADTFRGYDHAALAERVRSDLPALEHVVVVRGAPGPQAPSPGPGGEAGAESRLATTAFQELLERAEGGEPEPGRSPDDPVVLLYTSGTESDPKGAMHSHNTLGYEDRSMVDHFGLTGSDVVFMPSPVAHITGVLYGFHLPVVLGSSVVFQDVWDAGVGLRLIEQERCSFAVAATPFLYGITYHERLAEHDVTSLRAFACGGADVPPDLIRAATEQLDCCAVRVYGSTEIPTLTAGGCGDTVDQRAETDGRPVGIAEARLVDDDGGAVGPGVVGNLLARGPDAFLGYFGSARQAFDDEGWFATGDLARIDDDGFVQIAGRSKDIILRGGENISTKEVEDLLFGHPDVAEVAIVAMPDPRMVERACAVVVPRPGVSLRLADLVGYLDGLQIARQKYPERLEIVAELPKTPTGKVQKYQLRKYVADRLAAGPQST